MDSDVIHVTVPWTVASRTQRYNSTNALQVFRQLTHVTELHKNVTSSPEFTQLQLDFGDACDCLIEELRDLQRHSSAAVLHLVMDVFKETTEPLSRLLRFALATSQVSDMDSCQYDVTGDITMSQVIRHMSLVT